MARTSTKRSIVERCWVLVGRRQGRVWLARKVRPTQGTPASVQFDPRWVIDREERSGDVVGFYHTHPSGLPTPSERDLKTMRAWVGSFGKPLFCLIEASGTIAAYRFENDKCSGIAAATCEQFPRGVIVVVDEK